MKSKLAPIVGEDGELLQADLAIDPELYHSYTRDLPLALPDSHSLMRHRLVRGVLVVVALLLVAIILPHINELFPYPAITIPQPSTAYVTHFSDMGYISSVQWSPNGEQLAIVGVTSALVRNLDTTWVSESILLNRTFSLAWSPDGARLAVSEMSDDKVWNEFKILDVRTRSILYSRPFIPIKNDLYDPLTDIRWSPDGQYLAGFSQNILYYFDVALNLSSKIVLPSRDKLGYDDYQWLPGSHSMILMDADAISDQTLKRGELYEWPIGSAKARTIYSRSWQNWLEKADAFKSIAVSPDGQSVALAEYRQTNQSVSPLITIIDIATGQKRHSYQIGQSFPPNPAYPYLTEDISVAWSPDGQYIAAVIQKRPVVHIWNTKTGALTTQHHIAEGQYFWDISWSPDSHHLVIGGDQYFTIWSLE
jgi:WD40 repeat protein